MQLVAPSHLADEPGHKAKVVEDRDNRTQKKQNRHHLWRGHHIVIFIIIIIVIINILNVENQSVCMN